MNAKEIAEGVPEGVRSVLAWLSYRAELVRQFDTDDIAAAERLGFIKANYVNRTSEEHFGLVFSVTPLGREVAALLSPA